MSARCLLAKMLEKASEKRIELQKICLARWFLTHYRLLHGPPCDKLESSTKMDHVATKTESFSEMGTAFPLP